MKAQLSQLQLKDIQILKFNLEENIKGKNKFNIDINFEPIKAIMEDKEFDGLQFFMKINNKNKQVKLKADIELIALFEFSENLSEEKKARLLLYNGLSIIYGFVRGIIFQKCSYLNPSDRLLPSINLLELIEKRLESFDENE